MYVRRICVVATAERKLAKRAGEAVGAATGGDCYRATCRRCNETKQNETLVAEPNDLNNEAESLQ